jgi:hypothetical protein
MQLNANVMNETKGSISRASMRLLRRARRVADQLPAVARQWMRAATDNCADKAVALKNLVAGPPESRVE